MGTITRNLTITMLIAALVPVPAASKESLRLKPNSPWNIDYAEDSCRMARSFGEGDQKVRLIAERYEPGDSMRLSFIGKPAFSELERGTVKIRFGPAEPVLEVFFFPASAGKGVPALVVGTNVRIAPRSDEELAANKAALKAGKTDFKWSNITPEQEAAVAFIEVGGTIRHPFILETGSLGPPLAALRKCTDELLEHWGIDVAKHASLTREATPTSRPGTWVTSRDYPLTMAALGKRAIVQFRLNIDSTGTPTACHIQQSTRPKEFDDAVCNAIMRRAKFEPALDVEGNPIASYWSSSVTFLG